MLKEARAKRSALVGLEHKTTKDRVRGKQRSVSGFLRCTGMMMIKVSKMVKHDWEY